MCESPLHALLIGDAIEINIHNDNKEIDRMLYFFILLEHILITFKVQFHNISHIHITTAFVSLQYTTKNREKLSVKGGFFCFLRADHYAFN